MRVVNVYTNEKVRVPRKLQKRIEKKGFIIEAAYKARYYPWELFMQPTNGWVTIKKMGPNYRAR
jgi:hypothetical protein